MSGCGGRLVETEGTANPSPNPNRNPTSPFSPRPSSLSVGLVLGFSGDDSLVFEAWFSPQGVVPPTPLLFTILGHFAVSLALQAQRLCQPLFVGGDSILSS